MDKTLNWFYENYQETKDECRKILIQAQKDFPFTIEKIQEGCIELRKIKVIEKDSLSVHIQLLGELSSVGVNATKAGIKLRKALIKLNLP